MMMIAGLIIMVAIPSSYAQTSPLSHSDAADYNEQISWQQNLLWHLGKNLSIGDSYTYKICDPDVIQTSAANYHYFVQGKENHNSSVCYVIKMDFVNLLNSDENQVNRDIWVVQATIYDNTNKEDLRFSVYHIDAKTFEVGSADTIHPDTIKYADSLQNTLFSLFKHTATEPQLLQTGADWGEVTEALRERGKNPHITVLDSNQEYSVNQDSLHIIDNQNIPDSRNITDAFKVGYEIDIFDTFTIIDDGKNKKNAVQQEEENDNNVTNYFLISSEMPFPVAAVSYSPVHIVQPQKQYEFELVSFLANSNNVGFEMKSVSEELEDEDVGDSDLISETGTIALTFPHVVIPVEDKKEDVIDGIVDDDASTSPDNDDTNLADTIHSVEQGVIVQSDPNDDFHDDNVVVQSDDDDVVDYASIVGLVVLLGIMIAGFVVFKKFKESGFRIGLKKTSKKKRHQQQQQQTVKKIIQFDNKLQIDIKTIPRDI